MRWFGSSPVNVPLGATIVEASVSVTVPAKAPAGSGVASPKFPWSNATKAGRSASSLASSAVSALGSPMNAVRRSRKMSSLGSWLPAAS